MAQVTSGPHQVVGDQIAAAVVCNQAFGVWVFYDKLALCQAHAERNRGTLLLLLWTVNWICCIAHVLVVRMRESSRVVVRGQSAGRFTATVHSISALHAPVHAPARFSKCQCHRLV
jgi:hypothetical protein